MCYDVDVDDCCYDAAADNDNGMAEGAGEHDGYHDDDDDDDDDDVMRMRRRRRSRLMMMMMMMAMGATAWL